MSDSKLEAHRHAVAEVFSALDAKTGSGVAARFHGERVGINLGFVANGDFVGLELKARVDLAVHRDVGGLNGESGSAENGDSDKRLLEHNLVIQIKGKIWEALQKPLFPSRIEQNCSVRFFFTTSKNGVFLPSK